MHQLERKPGVVKRHLLGDRRLQASPKDGSREKFRSQNFRANILECRGWRFCLCSSLFSCSHFPPLPSCRLIWDLDWDWWQTVNLQPISIAIWWDEQQKQHKVISIRQPLQLLSTTETPSTLWRWEHSFSFTCLKRLKQETDTHTGAPEIALFKLLFFNSINYSTQ